MQENDQRTMCYRCHKPGVVCVCGRIEPVHNRTGIVILQHEKERFHPVGTARFACLGLTRSRLIVLRPGEREGLNPPLEFPPGSGLLFPGPQAHDLQGLSPDRRPEHLVVLDGTWRHARALLRSTPELVALPRFALQPATPSAYRIRREPRPECLSTIESIVAALRILEPETRGLDALIDVFHSMVEQQIYWEAVGHERRARRVPCSHRDAG
jgi:hypothetical protein